MSRGGAQTFAIDALESGGRDAAPRRILSYRLRPVRCGGEAACLDRAMGWVLAPLRNADRADRWAGERARKLVAGPIWAGPVRAGATWRAGQSAETSFSSGGGGFSWAGLVLHHPRRLASFLRTLATGRTAGVPITGSPTACGPARVRSVVLGIDGLSGIDGTRGLRGIRSVSVKGRPAGSGLRERRRKTQSGEGGGRSNTPPEAGALPAIVVPPSLYLPDKAGLDLFASQQFRGRHSGKPLLDRRAGRPTRPCAARARRR